MPNTIRRRLAVARVAALALAAPLAPARADDGAPDVGEGPKKLAAYIGCAASIGLAPNVYAAAMGAINCFKMYIDELRGS